MIFSLVSGFNRKHRPIVINIIFYLLCRVGFPRNSQFSCVTVAWFCTKWLFLHEIPHHFRINTKPVLNESAHSFEINNFFLHKMHEYEIQVRIFSWYSHEYRSFLHVISQSPWIRKIEIFVQQCMHENKTK